MICSSSALRALSYFRLFNSNSIALCSAFSSPLSYVVSSADVAALNNVPRTVSAAEYPHVARWAKHIQSYPAAKVASAPAAAAAAAAPAASADDDDMFGDEDDEEEMKKEMEKARIAAAHAVRCGLGD